MAGWRWPHFRPRELACRCQAQACGGEYWHDPDFLDALEALRTLARKPIRINSGHRCAVRNHLVGGDPNSRHRRIAADIALTRHDRHALLKSAQACGFTGIGRGRTFLHLDRRKTPAIWTYPGAAASWQR